MKFTRRFALQACATAGVAATLPFASLAQPSVDRGRWETLKEKFPWPMGEAVNVAVAGKLYVVSGLDNNLVTPTGALCEFDPATRAWTKKTPMPKPAHHVGAVEVNGKLYVFGGFIAGSGPGAPGWQPVDYAYEYNPQTDNWRELAPAPTKRGAGVAVVVNGKIYYIGGAMIVPGSTDPVIRFDAVQRDMAVGTVEEYDVSTNTWRTRAPMPTPRNHFGAAMVNGRIYAVGGRLGSAFILRATPTDMTEEYDPGADRWLTRAPMPTARSGLSVNAYKGKIYAGGGEFQSEKLMGAFRALEAYDPSTNSWDTAPRMPYPRHGFQGAVLGDELHYVGGGTQTDVPLVIRTDAHDVFHFPR
jgi:N-acetylneuraminic acid mutarotase